MKKIMAIIITMIMVVCNCMVVFGNTDTATTVPTSYPKDVTATYNSSTTSTYKVDITWASMEFTYSLGDIGKWDTENHEYIEGGSGAGWGPKTEEANKITVVNHSDAAVDVIYSFSNAGNIFTNVTGSFSNATQIGSTQEYQNNLSSAVGWSDGSAQKNESLLSLTGVPTAQFSTSTAQRVGTVTVKITEH